MIEVSVNIPPELLKQLDPANVTRALHNATAKVGELVRGELSKSTPPVHRPVIWASPAQRAAYFAQRRARGLPPEYTRNSDPMSQRLQRSWTVASVGATDAVVATRGVTYASYVQAEQYQSAQHRATGWVTDVQACNTVQRSGDVERITEAEAKSAMGI